MQDPTTLVTNLVTALQAIPGVVTLLENTAANVVGYSRNYPSRVNFEQAINEMNPPGILVAHLRTTFGRHIEHLFAIVLRPKGSPDALFAAIREGVPTGYGNVKFKRAQINPDCLPPHIDQYAPRLIIIGDNSFLEIHELQITMRERGVDT